MSLAEDFDVFLLIADQSLFRYKMNDGYDWRVSPQYTIHQMRLLLAKLGVDDSNTRSSVSSSLSILFISAIKARMELTAIAEMIVCRSKCLWWFMKDFSHFWFMFRPEDHSPLWKTFVVAKWRILSFMLRQFIGLYWHVADWGSAWDIFLLYCRVFLFSHQDMVDVT